MKRVNFIKKPVFIFFSIFVVAPAFGGELTLTNGDVIHGELHTLTEDSIIWSSEILGDITIPREKVQQFTPSIAAADDAPQELSDVDVQAPPPPSTFTGDIKLGYNRKRGNTDTEDVDFSTRSKWEQGLLRHEALLVAESEKVEGSVIDEKYVADYQLNYDFDENWFNYGKLRYEKDRFSADDEQTQLGGGIGYRVELDNQLQVNAQLGASYLITHQREGGTDKDPAGRWALKLDWPIADSEMTLFHHHEFLWPLTDTNDYQVESSTGVKVPLIGGIFSELRYDYDYVNQVEGDQEHADHEWVVLLGYHW